MAAETACLTESADFFWTTFWGLYISWGSSDSVTVIQHKPGYWHISEWTGWRHKAWSQSSARKAISHPDDDEALAFIHMDRTVCSWLISFCLEWRATKARSCSVCSCCFSPTVSCICYREAQIQRGGGRERKGGAGSEDVVMETFIDSILKESLTIIFTSLCGGCHIVRCVTFFLLGVTYKVSLLSLGRVNLTLTRRHLM